MPELSIIVPVYKVERYLPRCIESILNQTYKDFELILINDGSPDRCGEICDEYAKKDSRIVVLHQENKGVSVARNVGLRAAKGKYIGFVDSDDWIDKEMYYRLINALEETKSELACCNWDIYNSEMYRREHRVNIISKLMEKEEFVIHLFDLPRTVGGTIWNKVFHKDKIKSKFAEDIQIGEDAVFISEYCLNVSRVVYINESLYHYFERNESVTRENPEKIALVLHVKKRMIDILGKISKKVRDNAERDYLDSCLLYYNLFRKNPKSAYLKLGKDHLQYYIQKHFIRVLMNKEISHGLKFTYIMNGIGIRFE